MNWKYKIGDIICNDITNITILDKEIRFRTTNCKGKIIEEKRKYYKYKCNKCGYEDG